MATDARIIDLIGSSCSKKERHEKRWLSALCGAARMSAVAGDLGQPASGFAGLAAIATILLLGTSASRMRAFVWILRAHRFPSSGKMGVLPITQGYSR
jgi:hypothetical protein